jgi:hypothetical protein
MAKIVVKDGELSSSAGINVPGSFSISGNVEIGDNFTDTLTVNSSAIFNDDLTVLDIISGSTGRFTSVTASDVVIYGTASLSTNPNYAYIIYNPIPDSLVAYPGLIISGSLRLSYTNVTASYSVSSKDCSIFVTGGPYTITIPAAVENPGRKLIFKKAENTSTVVTISASAGNIDGNIINLSTPYQSIILLSNGVNWFVIK